jgi:signal transduction histidine kinase
VFEDGDADRALETDGADAVVEGAAALIAEEFEVIDTGPGFDDEDLAAVFELGEEGDAAGGGGGLGGDGGN